MLRFLEPIVLCLAKIRLAKNLESCSSSAAEASRVIERRSLTFEPSRRHSRGGVVLAAFLSSRYFRSFDPVAQTTLEISSLPLEQRPAPYTEIEAPTLTGFISQAFSKTMPDYYRSFEKTRLLPGLSSEQARQRK